MEKAARRRIWLLVLVFACGIAVGLTISEWKWMLIDIYQRFTKSPPVHQSIAAMYAPDRVPCGLCLDVPYQPKRDAIFFDPPLQINVSS